jgi:anti-sigma factor RsiW
MTCQETEEQLAAHLDGELSQSEAAAVAEHLASCTACAAERATIGRVRRAVEAGLAAVTPRSGGDGFGALWERIEAEGGEAGTQPVLRALPGGGARRRVRWTRVLAGGLAAVLALGLWWSSAPEPSSRVASLPAAGRPAAVPEVARRDATAQAAPPAARPEEAKPVAVARAKPETAAPRRSEVVANVSDHARDAPPDLRRRAELFLEYPIVRRLEEFEHFDEVMVLSKGERGRRG